MRGILNLPFFYGPFSSANSTGVPCSECTLHGRDCIIDEYADKRRKVVRDRAQEELAYYREFVQQLLAAIRHGKRTDVDAIINVIRSGASLEKIHLIVAQSLSHTNDVDGLEITVPKLKVPEGVSAEASPGDKEPSGVSVESSPDAGLSTVLNKDS
ncbi:hypothetical protein Aspvir_002680 [Aspergillus viridinutans]|uniref:Uncharacterized protein n=1 Tax=Aspergillus viridinutans TaxID=75553 RepID=A0A9P3C3Q0_ASPVI|nr:uncharacterized protein Aspvir_002680 [Aspergillus viridinutans]GIK07027.1 hypothetical protein Aspvir_002680 [Aspergillus viridinutans]